MVQRKYIQPGFSIIELAMVIAIIGILLGGILGGRYLIQRAQRNTTKSTLITLRTSLDSFRNDTGSYPNNLTELRNKPLDEKVSKKWEGPYLDKEITTDSFGNELVYRVTKGAKHPYELSSYGSGGEGAPQDEWISVWDL